MQKIALVTGGNRGIGFEICRQLAELGLKVVLASRDAQKGEDAAHLLQRDGLEVIFHPLEVTNPLEIGTLKHFIEQSLGRLDVLVNNAAIYPDEGKSVLTISPDLVRQTFEINTLGPLMLMQAFAPLMRDQNYGRIVNLSSSMGQISHMGGYTGAYRISKAALNAATRVVAAELRGYNIKVNSMDPGWVHTDMGGSHAPRTPGQGADTAVWLATLPDDGPTNGFFYERQSIAW